MIKRINEHFDKEAEIYDELFIQKLNMSELKMLDKLKCKKLSEGLQLITFSSTLNLDFDETENDNVHIYNSVHHFKELLCHL